MVLDIVKDKENYQKHLHEYKRQRKRRTWEVTQQFIKTQEKARAYAKFWVNIDGKHCCARICLSKL